MSEGTFSDVTITKKCLYNIDPLKPHFCIVKLGFKGVIHYLFFISTRRGGSNEYPQAMFRAEM